MTYRNVCSQNWSTSFHACFISLSRHVFSRQYEKLESARWQTAAVENSETRVSVHKVLGLSQHRFGEDIRLYCQELQDSLWAWSVWTLEWSCCNSKPNTSVQVLLLFCMHVFLSPHPDLFLGPPNHLYSGCWGPLLSLAMCLNTVIICIFITSVTDDGGRDSLQNVGDSFCTDVVDHLRIFHCIPAFYTFINI